MTTVNSRFKNQWWNSVPSKNLLRSIFETNRKFSLFYYFPLPNLWYFAAAAAQQFSWHSYPFGLAGMTTMMPQCYSIYTDPLKYAVREDFSCAKFLKQDDAFWKRKLFSAARTFWCKLMWYWDIIFKRKEEKNLFWNLLWMFALFYGRIFHQ